MNHELKRSRHVRACRAHVAISALPSFPIRGGEKPEGGSAGRHKQWYALQVISSSHCYLYRLFADEYVSYTRNCRTGWRILCRRISAFVVSFRWRRFFWND